MGNRHVIGTPLLEVLPEIGEQDCCAVLRELAAGRQASACDDGVVALRSRSRPSATTYWQITCTQLSRNGVVCGIVVVLSEITQHVVAQSTLRQLAAEADAASRARERFLAVLGHELRHPLSPIVTALELIRMRGFALRDLALVERQVGRLVRLVDDLLDVSRATHGKLELRKRPMELSNVVAAAVETVKPLVEERQHRLAIHVPADLGVEVDLDRMCQVVSNLLVNAVKYSAVGSRTSIVAERKHGKVRLSVIDEGVGIEPHRLEQVFDAFTRHDNADGRGLGLGLAIVRNLVHLHGGRVRAYSGGRWKGSAFVVDLPWVPLRTSPARAAHPAFREPTSSKRLPAPSQSCRS